MEKMCQLFSVSRSGFYKWLKHQPSQREHNRSMLVAVIKATYAEHKGRIGSPMMKQVLLSRGICAGKNRIAQIMREHALRSITQRKFVVTTDSKHSLPVAENLLNRQFHVSEPHKVLVSDITYVKTAKGWTYLAVFIDLFSRMVVGWAVSSSLSTQLVITALRRAIRNRQLSAGVMIHSDRGCQYASEQFRALLTEHGFIQSMSRKGNCWDNAVAEAFFRIYKTEMAYHHSFVSHEDMLHESFSYIEEYYNRKRKHGSLGYLTPAEFEKQFRLAA